MYKPIGPFQLTPDSTGLKLIFNYRWKLDTWYQLIIDKGFVTDSLGKINKIRDTLRFKSKAESDYGSIKIQFENVNFALNPVLVWLEGGKIVKSVPLSGPTFFEKIFKPAEYEIRILYDQNKNGVWDTGDYWKKRQPERVLAIEKKINVKANWENEITIDINAQEEEEDKK